jgi:RNA polymerase sigma factor FliA
MRPSVLPGERLTRTGTTVPGCYLPVDEAEVRARIEQLTVEMLPQARAEAYKVWQRAPHALEMDELTSLALSGLAHAAARWPFYCAKNHHDPTRFEFFPAYALRRMRGSMLDWLRSQDWVTRSARTRAKALREAGQDAGLTEAELAAATDMSVAEVRETLAAVAVRPVSIDAEPHDVAGIDDVEGQAVVLAVMEAVAAVLGRQSAPVRALVALRYYHGLSVAEAAVAVGVEEEEAQRLFQAAVVEIHDAMLKVVA